MHKDFLTLSAEGSMMNSIYKSLSFKSCSKVTCTPKGHLIYFFFSVLVFEPVTSQMTVKCSVTKLYSQAPLTNLLYKLTMTLLYCFCVSDRTSAAVEDENPSTPEGSPGGGECPLYCNQTCSLAFLNGSLTFQGPAQCDHYLPPFV